MVFQDPLEPYKKNGTKLTFDCGKLLPGYGESDFDDYDPPLDDVDVPGTIGWDDAGNDNDVDPQLCQCQIIPYVAESSTEFLYGFDGGQHVIRGYLVCLTFLQECKEADPSNPPTTIQNLISQFVPNDGNNVRVDGITGSPCSCGSNECPPITICYELPLTGDRPNVTPPPGGGGGPTPGPTTPGPGGGGNIKCLCVVKSVTTRYVGPTTPVFDDSAPLLSCSSFEVNVELECKRYDINNPVENDQYIKDSLTASITRGAYNDLQNNGDINPPLPTSPNTFDDIGKDCCEDDSGPCENIIYTYVVCEPKEPVGTTPIETGGGEPGDGIIFVADPIVDQDLISDFGVTNESDPGGGAGDGIIFVDGSVTDQDLINDFGITDGVDSDPPQPPFVTAGGLTGVVVPPQPPFIATNGLTGIPSPPSPGGGGVTGIRVPFNQNAGVFVSTEGNSGGGGGGNSGSLGLPSQTVNAQVEGDFKPSRILDEGIVQNNLLNQSGEIDLNNPLFLEYLSNNDLLALTDDDISIRKNRKPKGLVQNNLYLNIFKDQISKSLSYLLNYNNRFSNWDEAAIFDIRNELIIPNLNNTFLSICKSIKNHDGTPLSDKQISDMIVPRIIENRLDEINVGYLKQLSRYSQSIYNPVIRPSSLQSVNEVTAFALMKKLGIPLDPAKAPGKTKEVVKNWKTLATDVGKYIPITVEGETKKYYIKDTDEFIDRSTLKIRDGDYFDVTVSGSSYRLFVESQKDHAYIVTPKDRYKVFKLLGANPENRITVSALESDNIEYNYSLSSPRQNFYVLSCVLSSINSIPARNNSLVSQLVKNSTARYELVDINNSTTLEEFNEYIKYKINGKTVILDDEDLIFDYVEATSSLQYEQNDVLFDASKSSKDTPLFIRQIPWYIILYPTNRFEYTISPARSNILSYESDGVIVRELNITPILDPLLSQNSTSLFTTNRLPSRNEFDVLGNYQSLGRLTEINPNNKQFLKGFNSEGRLISSQEKPRSRKKTGLRVIKEIISEISNNYLLDDEGLDYGINSFDLFSRMTLDEYNSFVKLENSSTLYPLIKNGLFEGVKVYSPIKGAGTNAEKKTRIVQRKEGAPADTYVPIKYLRTGQTIEPPTTSFNSSEVTSTPTRRPTR